MPEMRLSPQTPTRTNLYFFVFSRIAPTTMEPMIPPRINTTPNMLPSFEVKPKASVVSPTIAPREFYPAWIKPKQRHNIKN